MKEVLLGLILCVGLVAFNACGSDDNKGGKKSIIDTNKNYINLTTNLETSSNTFSLSTIGITYPRFGVGVIKDGEPVTLYPGMITWTYEGPDVGTLTEFGSSGYQAILNTNGNTGSIIVKAQYETIFSTIQIHIVP
jgi:hypothetical protein